MCTLVFSENLPTPYPGDSGFRGHPATALGWQDTLVSLLSHPEASTFDKHGQLWETKTSPNGATVLPQFTKGKVHPVSIIYIHGWTERLGEDKQPDRALLKQERSGPRQRYHPESDLSG